MSQGFKRSSKSCIFVFVATRRTSPDVTTVFHTWVNGRFIEIQSNVRRKNFIERIKALIFLEAVLAIEIM